MIKGSLRQVLLLTLPLLLGSLSDMLMLFIDRLILAYYSLDAHNAAVESMNLGWAFLRGWVSLACVVQIFVAQNHGAGNNHLLGRPVWQMIWMGLFSCLAFWPAAIWGPGYFFEDDPAYEMQRTYLFWMVIFGPGHVLFSALSGFFIGQGKIALISIIVLVGNLINTSLCYLLVFGWDEIIPSIGIQGSAISTNAAVVGQLIILLCAFFKRSNRESYGTTQWKWSSTLFKQCLRVGLPSAVFGVLEVTGWAIFYQMMASLGEKHLTVAGIVQNVLILFNFFGEGLSRAVAILSGNAIGSKNMQAVFKYVHTGFVLMTFFALLLALILWGMNHLIIDWFLSSVSDTQRLLFQSSLVFGLANAIIYKYLEGIRLIMAGALSAAADTFFLLVAGACSIWLFMVLPIYKFVWQPGASIETALILCSGYTLMAATLYAYRFYRKGWQKNHSLVLNNA